MRCQHTRSLTGFAYIRLYRLTVDEFLKCFAIRFEADGSVKAPIFTERSGKVAMI
jgi:hypothetical protein